MLRSETALLAGHHAYPVGLMTLNKNVDEAHGSRDDDYREVGSPLAFFC